jgi:hypothetical protein
MAGVLNRYEGPEGIGLQFWRGVFSKLRRWNFTVVGVGVLFCRPGQDGSAGGQRDVPDRDGPERRATSTVAAIFRGQLLWPVRPGQARALHLDSIEAQVNGFSSLLI